MIYHGEDAKLPTLHLNDHCGAGRSKARFSPHYNETRTE